MKMLTLTLLDLGGVVFQSTGTSNAQIDWSVISRLNKKYGHALNIGEDVFPAFLSEYNALTHQSLSGTDFLKSVFDTLEINTELIEIARAHGDIVIVSDNYRENIAYISERYDFESWAVRQVYSFDYQMHKSNPVFFQKLLDELEGYPKDNMILIDDSQRNIDSAQKNGIRGIQFKNNEQLKKEWETLT
jgi:HAD superfamily hydrolase (TIGR01509 family)